MKNSTRCAVSFTGFTKHECQSADYLIALTETRLLSTEDLLVILKERMKYLKEAPFHTIIDYMENLNLEGIAIIDRRFNGLASMSLEINVAPHCETLEEYYEWKADNGGDYAKNL